MLTEEECVWIRMAIDRQLLMLKHALLWLQVSSQSDNNKTQYFITELLDNLQIIQHMLQPQK